MSGSDLSGNKVTRLERILYGCLIILEPKSQIDKTIMHQKPFRESCVNMIKKIGRVFATFCTSR